VRDLSYYSDFTGLSWGKTKTSLSLNVALELGLVRLHIQWTAKVVTSHNRK